MMYMLQNVTSGAVTLVSAGPSGPIPSAAALQASHPPVTGGPTGAFPPPPPESGHGTPPAIQMRGGTTYFSPNLQPAHPGPSPARRPKAAIPIVNPQVRAALTIRSPPQVSAFLSLASFCKTIMSRTDIRHSLSLKSF